MLNIKQKKQLRSIANNLKPYVIVGKDGVNENLIVTLNDSLVAHELVKVSVLKNSSLSINEVAIELSRLTNSEIIQIIGRVVILYKQSKRKIIKLC